MPEGRRCERTLRALNVWKSDVGGIVEAVDVEFGSGLALFIAGQMRAPDDLAGIYDAAERWLMLALSLQAGPETSR